VFKNGNGQVVNDFFIDYLSAKTGTPSGYASLGVAGGDGSLVSGPAPLSWDTSLAMDLNNTGYFAGGAQTAATLPPNTNGSNLLINSPPTLSNADYTLATPNPWTNGWEFRDLYTVTVSNSIFGASGFGAVTVPFVHNSPSKPLACPGTTGGGTCNLTVTKKEVKDKQVKITIKNNGSADEFITALSLTWPSATNGALTKVKLDGNVIYDKPDIVGGSATLTAAQLTSDQNKRKIKKGGSGVLTFEFAKNADKVLANYTGTVTFGPNCVLTILP
jgi:hypothetical protein